MPELPPNLPPSDPQSTPIRPEDTQPTQPGDVDFDAITKSEGFDVWLTNWFDGVQKENEQSRASVAGRIDKPHDMASELAKIIEELNPHAEDVIAHVPLEEIEFCDELDAMMESLTSRQSTPSPLIQRETENAARNFDAYLTDTEEDLEAMQSSSSVADESSVQAPATAPHPPAANPAKPDTITNALKSYWKLVDGLNNVLKDPHASLAQKEQANALKKSLINALGPDIAKVLESSKIRDFASIDDTKLSQATRIITKYIAYKSALDDIKAKLEESQGGDKKLRYKTTTGELQSKDSHIGVRLGLLGKSRASKKTMEGILLTIKTILEDRQTPVEIRTLAQGVLKTIEDHPWGAGVLSSRNELKADHSALKKEAGRAAHSSSATLDSILETLSESALAGGASQLAVRSSSESVRTILRESVNDLTESLLQEPDRENILSSDITRQPQTVASFKELHQEELGPLEKRYQEISALIEEQKEARKLLKPFIQLKIGIKGVPFLYQCIKQRRLLNELETLYFKEQIQAAKKNESETGPIGSDSDAMPEAEDTTSEDSTTETLPGVHTLVDLTASLNPLIYPLSTTSTQYEPADFADGFVEVYSTLPRSVLDAMGYEVDPDHFDVDLGFLADLLAGEATPVTTEGEAVRRADARGLWGRAEAKAKAEARALHGDEPATVESVKEQTTLLGKAIGNLEQLQTKYPAFISEDRLAILREKFQSGSKVHLEELSPDDLQGQSNNIRDLSEQVRSVENDFLEAIESQRQAKIEHEKNQTEAAKVFLKGLTSKIEGMTDKQKLVIAEQRGATSRDLLASQSEEVPLPKPEDLLAAFTTEDRGKFGKTGTSTEAKRTLAKLVEICEGYSELKGASKECETLFKALRKNDWFKEALSNNPDLQQKFLSVTAAVELPDILTLISSLNQPENVKMKLVLEDGTVVFTKRQKGLTEANVGTGQESVDVVMHMLTLGDSLIESKKNLSYIEPILEKLSTTKAEDSNKWLHAVVSKHPEISKRVSALKSEIASRKAAKEANISDSQLVDNLKDRNFGHNFLLSYGFVINELYNRETDTRPDCVKLFAFLNKVFADVNTPFEVRANIMHMAKEWVTTPFINGGPANIALAQGEIGNLSNKAKESGSPTLSNLADSIDVPKALTLAIAAEDTDTGKFVDGNNKATEVFKHIGQGAEVDPAYVEDLAKSLTACHTASFADLTASEFSRLAWNSKTAKTASPSIVQLTNNFNAITNFVLQELVINNRALNPTDNNAFFEHMARQLSFLMDVVDELLRPGTPENPKAVDVHSAFAIMAAINDTSINRLRPLVDDKIDKTRLRKFEENSRITNTSGAYAAQRKFETSISESGTVIPYMGSHLSDLTFTAEGNPTHTEGQVSTTIPAIVGRSLTFVQKVKSKLSELPDSSTKAVFNMASILATKPSQNEAYNISLDLKTRGS